MILLMWNTKLKATNEHLKNPSETQTTAGRLPEAKGWREDEEGKEGILIILYYYSLLY